MAPLALESVTNLIAAATPDLSRRAQHEFVRRALAVNSTQKVTLGIIAVYVVVIALLWNIPYVRYSLWPFKVSESRGKFVEEPHSAY